MHKYCSISQEADSDSDSSNAVESMSFEYSINGVFYDVTLQRDVEENEVVVTLRANSPQQEFFLFQCSVFPLLSITEMPARSLYVTNSVNVGVLGASDA